MTMKKIALALIAILIAVGTASARKVTGTVTSGEEKLGGVVVTDGKNFTQTKKNGKFAFNIEDDAEFVYILTPSGYVADYSSGVPAFYQSAEGRSKFSFDLIKTGEGNDYHLVAIGDAQIKNDEHFAIFEGEPIDDMAALGKTFTKPAAGLALGDICWDELQYFKKYKKEIVRTGFPVYPVLGNHDNERNASGDHNGSATYRKEMGPENYAFFMGKDVVLVLDNIIYSTKRKYVEGYAEHVLDWVKNVMKFIPQNADIYVAQHSMLKLWPINQLIKDSDKLLDIIRGHKVLFLTGHSHICNNMEIEENITEHNVAAICGTWWDTYYCNDGTPRGYKVYTKDAGKLEWYYKSVGKDKDYQVELYMPGQSVMHPNSIVLNIWDYDPQWKVEWYEDGKPMGKMDQVIDISPVYIREMYKAFEGRIDALNKKAYKYPRLNTHYLVATPSQYAKNVTVAVESPFGKKWVYNVDMSDYVDVQAHRGGMGLMPENTLEAMKNALDLGVNTLELDLQISKDGKVVVSHDAYFHYRYATRPDGTPVNKGDAKEYIYTLNYEDIARYDVGSKANPDWPERACLATRKPLLDELIDFVENYTKEKGYSPVRYNIEIKTREGNGEGIYWPIYHDFVDACAKVLLSKHLDDRLVVQCFDPRALNFMHEKYPEFHLSYLVDAKAGDFDKYMAKLKFQPEWLSPHYSIVDEALVAKCREKGMKMVPWTVDNPADLQRMIDLKVEAIITNYPDRLLMLTRGYAAPAPGPIVMRTH